MKYTVLLLLFAIGFLGGVIWFTNKPSDQKIQWCPGKQHAVVVGSGRDVTGTITVLYGCESDLEAKL